MSRSPRTDKRVWLRVLARVRPFRSTLALAIGASVIAAAAGGVWASLLGPLLRSLISGSGATWGPFQLQPSHLIREVPLAIIAVALVKALASWVHTGLMSRVSQGVLRELRRELYERLLTLPPRWFEQRHSGELLSRFTADVAQLEFSAGAALASATKDSLQVVALLIVCAITDWRLFLVIFVVLPGTIIPVSRFARSAKKAATKTQASLGQLSMLATEQLNALPIVQAFNAEGVALQRFDAEQGRYLTAMKRSLFVRGAFSPTTEFLGVIGVAAALILGARAVQTDPSLAGKLVTFLASALLLYQPIKALSQTASQVSVGAGSATRLFEVLDALPDVDAGAQASPLRASLKLNEVRLTYADGREALKGVTFEVKAGEHVALVGPSGAGKSSVVSLLLGQALISGGAISWDDQSLTALQRRSVRAQIAWVPQEPVLLSGSIRENLLFARPEADEALLWQALTRAHADHFVNGFARGLDEDVGERGSRLSGGQRQRIAIARAFLREPSLLILDEPTSALDAKSEGEVQAGLEELMKGRTTLVIAHRLSTVRDADRIVVLEEGRVVEQGTHDALVASKGVYARLHFPEVR